MKQRLKSLKKNKIMIAAAIIVAAIVIVFPFIISAHKKSLIDKKLSKLQEETKNTAYEFEKKYVNASDEDAEKYKENFKRILDKFLHKNQDDSFKSLEEIKDILRKYPSVYAETETREDIYGILFGKVQHGLEAYNNFAGNMRLGIPGYLVMAQYTTDLSPIYYYIEFDGDSYHVVVDQTRDGYDEEYGYIESFGKYLKFEQYDSGDGGVLEYGYLTDNNELRYNQVIYQNQYNTGDLSNKLPYYWQFYVLLEGKEDWEKHVLAPDRISSAFDSEYTGYADLHPSLRNDNPISDYDGDGLLDRVYRKFIETNDGENAKYAYFFLGNGITVKMTDNLWGSRFSTQMKDITGDGIGDICFIQYDDAVTNRYDISVFEYTNGNYTAINMPDKEYSYVELNYNNSGILGIRFVEADDQNAESRFMIYRNGEWIIEE